MEMKRQSYWWWFDSHNSPSCSPWLQSTLAELNEKTKSMLKLIEEDADSFAQRAEMYYKKRPELISMVEDFYKAHRSLAERYDLLRTDVPGRVRPPLHNFFSPSSKDTVSVISSVKSYDSESFAEAYNSEDCAESEIDDPEVVDGSDGEHLVSEGLSCDEVMNLKEELERLQKENDNQREQIELKDSEIKGLMTQLYGLREESEILMSKYEIEKKEIEKREEKAKCELMKKVREETMVENMNLKNALAEKDEEKREVIRQLSMAIEILQEENQFLKTSTNKDGCSNGKPERWNSPQKQILKGVDLRKLFGFWSKYQTSVVPL